MLRKFTDGSLASQWNLLLSSREDGSSILFRDAVTCLAMNVFVIYVLVDTLIQKVAVLVTSGKTKIQFETYFLNDKGYFWFLPLLPNSGSKATIQNILFLVGNMSTGKVHCVILFFLCHRLHESMI
jgi:hypothetical protein